MRKKYTLNEYTNSLTNNNSNNNRKINICLYIYNLKNKYI